MEATNTTLTNLDGIEEVTGRIVWDDAKEWAFHWLASMMPLDQIHEIEHYYRYIIVFLLALIIIGVILWSCISQFLWKAKMMGLFAVMLSLYQLYVLAFWLRKLEL